MCTPPIALDELLLIHATATSSGEARLALEAAGYVVTCANELADALAVLQTREFAAVVIDCGTSIARCGGVDEVRGVTPHVPLLVMASTTEVAREAVKRGARDWVLIETFDDYLLSSSVRMLINRRRVEDSLFVERERALATLGSLGEAVVDTDGRGTITGLSPTAEVVTGWSADEATGRPFAEVCPLFLGETQVPAPDPLSLPTAAVDDPALTLVCRDGSVRKVRQAIAPVRDRSERVTGAVLVLHEVSSVWGGADPQHDYLTGLPTRVLLLDRTAQAIATARRTSTQLAVLFVDLDKFKQVNDSLGHGAGDALLKSVARRLEHSVRESDTVSRYGGDEFVVLLPATNRPQEAEIVAQKILSAIDAPYAVGALRLHLTASVGVSLYPKGGRDPEALVKCADIAMYCAKHAGGSGYRFYEPGMSIPGAARTLGAQAPGGFSPQVTDPRTQDPSNRLFN